MNLFDRWRSLPHRKSKEELDAHYDRMGPLEKGDMFAMVMAAFAALWPLLLILGLFIVVAILL